jgi:peptidoglycan/LPS O-acetylase OafA/YrhL
MSLAGISWGARFVLGIASSSVACLMIVAGYTSALSPVFGVRDRAYIVRRFKRLAPPYIGWSLIFLIAQAYLPFGRPRPDMDIVSVLTGTGIYPVLWFLPALFYANLLGWAIRSQRWRLFVGGAATGLFVFRAGVAWLFVLDPTGLFAVVVKLSPWFALFLFGQIAASTPQRLLDSKRAIWLLAVAGVSGLAGAALLTAVYYPASPSVVQTLGWVSGSAGVLALVVVASRRPGWRFLPALSGVTLGIYMMHLPILSLVSRIAPVAIVPWYIWLPVNVAFAVAVSGGVGVLLSRTPLRFLVS